MAMNRLHAEPVNGRALAVGPERARNDPALIPGQVETAANFVDMEDPQRWIDCFRLNGNIYEVNVCECLHPTIVCRTQGEDEPHTIAPSKTTNSMIEALKTEMGNDNYRIINVMIHLYCTMLSMNLVLQGRRQLLREVRRLGAISNIQ